MYFNKSIIAGKLTRDPELRHTPSGSPVCEMTIAVNRKFNGKDDVCYIDVIVWGKSGENCARYLSKGSSTLVEGYLKQETWTTQDGSRRNKIKLVAENVQFMSSPRSDRSEPDLPQEQSNRYSPEDNPEPPPTQPEPQPRFYGDTGRNYAPPPAQPTSSLTDPMDTEDDIPF